MADILKEELSLPRMVLKRSALDRNRAWMRGFLKLTGLEIAPHGKTPVSPEIIRMQLKDGSWGITAATTEQVKVFRKAGVKRILFANELAGRENVRYIVNELNHDPKFAFYCLVDSPEGVKYLAGLLREFKLKRPLQVLLEAGIKGGRGGVRTLEKAVATARAIGKAGRYLELKGVEGYEGAIPDTNEGKVRKFYAFMKRIARACEKEGLFAPGLLVMTAGGTSALDLVYREFRNLKLKQPHVTIVRSGCYIFSDHSAYGGYFDAMLKRTPMLKKIGPKPVPTLEVWGYVLSLPEPGLAILGFGKRECPYDRGLPVPLKFFRPDWKSGPKPLSSCVIVKLNDQHAFLRGPGVKQLAVGDMVCAGISHPCGVFERWRKVLVVDDKYKVLSKVQSFL